MHDANNNCQVVNLFNLLKYLVIPLVVMDVVHNAQLNMVGIVMEALTYIVIIFISII
jgi:hypothetical protein